MNDIQPIDEERSQTPAVERPDITPDPTGEGTRKVPVGWIHGRGPHERRKTTRGWASEEESRSILYGTCISPDSSIYTTEVLAKGTPILPEEAVDGDLAFAVAGGALVQYADVLPGNHTRVAWLRPRTPDITPDSTGEGSAWQPPTPAHGSDAEHLPRTESPMKVLRSIAGIRLDGEPDDEGLDSEMDIDDAFRLLSDVVESAREAIASQSVDPAPADQLDQLPDYRLLGQQNRDLTEAARRIVDLEEERDALKARVEELTTDLQTAKDALQEWMQEHRLTEEAGGIVERLHQEADGYRAQIAKLTACVGAAQELVDEFRRPGTRSLWAWNLAMKAVYEKFDALSATDEGRA